MQSKGKRREAKVREEKIQLKNVMLENLIWQVIRFAIGLKGLSTEHKM